MEAKASDLMQVISALRAEKGSEMSEVARLRHQLQSLQVFPVQ